MKMKKTVRLTLMAALIAIMVVMDFTPLGYIVTPTGFSITMMIIPVAVGAVTLGPAAGALLGFVFGLTSFLQAFGIGFFIDPSAAVLWSANPLAMAFTCFVPRMLMGALVGFIYMGLSRIKRFRVGAYAIASVSAPVLNTVFFLTAYLTLFSDTVLAGEVVKTIIVTLVSVNAVPEIAAALIIGTGLCQAFHLAVKKIR